MTKKLLELTLGEIKLARREGFPTFWFPESPILWKEEGSQWTDKYREDGLILCEYLGDDGSWKSVLDFPWIINEGWKKDSSVWDCQTEDFQYFLNKHLDQTDLVKLNFYKKSLALAQELKKRQELLQGVENLLELLPKLQDRPSVSIEGTSISSRDNWLFMQQGHGHDVELSRSQVEQMLPYILRFYLDDEKTK